MFEPTQTLPMTSSRPVVSSGSSPNGGEGVANEQAANFTPADIVDLSEMEYTQLKQLFCLPVDSQSNEGDAETRISAPFLPSSNTPQYQSTSLTISGSEGQNMYPVVSAISNLVPANQTLGHIDFQQLRVTMIRESGLPPPSGNVVENQLSNTAGDSSGAGPMWVRSASDGVTGLDKENENLGHIIEPRAKSTVRVRLEDRFNSLPTDCRQKCMEMSETGVAANNLVTIIRRPSQLLGPQQLSKCTPIVKSKAASSSLQLLYSSFNLQPTTPGNSDPLLKQASCSLNCGASCPLWQRSHAAKNQEISQSRGLESVKRRPRNKVPPEDILAKVEDTPCEKGLKKRRRSRLRQSDPDMERRVLSDIKNIPQGTPRPPKPEHTAEQGPDNKRASLFQRKERHNNMERERRRRIKVCCDELNNFVPFCTVVTDKATTLQWTASFLKYIQDTHGDTLKKEFEAVYCANTGKGMKVIKLEGASTGSAPEAAGSGSAHDAK